MATISGLNGPVHAQQPSPIYLVLGEVDTVIEQATNVVSELANRLDPVLCQRPTDNDQILADRKQEPFENQSSSIGSRLLEVHHTIANIVRQLQSIKARLDI
jgi:hypothetical protein